MGLVSLRRRTDGILLLEQTLIAGVQKVPELPEVETVVRTLRRPLQGASIVGVRLGPRQLRRPWPVDRNFVFTTPRPVLGVYRRGKWIRCRLRGGWNLLFHLGMTGRLRVTDAEAALEPHTHLVFDLSPGNRQIRFQDIRRFGVADLLTDEECEALLSGEQLGPEPFDLTAEQLWQKARGSKRCLKAILMDQSVTAGVGNIYADEALFEARLHPARLGITLRREEAQRLRNALVSVLHRAIEVNGSTIRTFFFGEDGRGGYQNEFRVYHQTGKPCPRCGAVIRRLLVAGRSTHFCPRCQPAPRRRARTGSHR
ncbi:MAG: bifunctional DNA-formamidopyrimidine glycosylase/DNA-(apurinic or apyrimidinic site) lyase [Gemmatales bacterium]|nr:bifunctional DNA-formamidopyrimidine glycosylase/DNA-(apurinic or apyrimidinic site) lyase [Gemmatales bacterium]MDW8387036.1 bifunctional DNA-formamidopyrimidine glycosylase/DNA-(apurinic or apyrimidinic site) lyase [Gemmatales bacterium]